MRDRPAPPPVATRLHTRAYTGGHWLTLRPGPRGNGPHRGNASAVAVVACNAMPIILGTAIASGSGSLSLWMARLFQFALAGELAVGMMSLVWPMAVARNPSPPAPPLPR